jgi:hypothetical protein
MAGAAAVLVFAAFGIEGWQSMNGAGDSNEDSGSGGGDSAALEMAPKDQPQGNQDDSGKAGGPATSFTGPRPEVTPESLPAFARHLIKRERVRIENGAPSPSGACATALADGGSGTSSAIIRWAGDRAAVIIDPDTRTATVFGCGTGSPELYSTSY